MSDFQYEPVNGLNGDLLEGETVLWQGAPEWKTILRSALHIRILAVYIAIMAVYGFAESGAVTAMIVVGSGLAALLFFAAFAWGVQKTSVYTLTNQRLVLRIGVALDKYVNIPLSQIETADLKTLPGDHGNIVLKLKGRPKMGYPLLWPHVRSLRLISPQPMLRAIAEPQHVARLMFTATSQLQEIAPATQDITARGKAQPEVQNDAPSGALPA